MWFHDFVYFEAYRGFRKKKNCVFATNSDFLVLPFSRPSQHLRPLVFQIVNSVWFSSKSLKYWWLTLSVWKEIRMWKFEFVAKTYVCINQKLNLLLIYFIPMFKIYLSRGKYVWNWRIPVLVQQVFTQQTMDPSSETSRLHA